MAITNISLVKPWDILLYKSTGEGDTIGNLIGYFTRSKEKYAHAAQYFGNGIIFESHLETGTTEKELNPKWHPFIDVYRYTGILSVQDMVDLEKAYRADLGKPYALADFPAAFVHSVIAKIFHADKYRKKEPLLNNTQAFYCSEYVVTEWFKALAIRLNPTVGIGSTTPQNLSEYASILRLTSC